MGRWSSASGPSVRASLVHELSPKLALAASFRWEDWSEFERQFVTIAGFKTKINRGWSDTYGGARTIEDLLTGKTWRLDAFADGSFEEAAMLSPEVTLEFTRDGALRGSAGCNQYFGQYTIRQNKEMLVSGVGATRMS